MHKTLKVTVSLLLSVMMLCTVFAIGVTQAFAATSTGVGLSAYVLNAYYEDWSYVWGGSSPGAVDCSGLIYSYNGVGGIRTDMLAASSEWGYVSNGIPRIHGLGLHHPGHVGVYVGNGMAIDARSSYYDMCYESVDSLNWVEWFKISGVSYPTEGWVRYNGDSFYYEDGQYLVNTSRTFDGVTYTFGSDGASDKAPADKYFEATDYTQSNVSISSGSSSSSGSTLLKIGSQGQAVEKLQNRLKALGYFEDDVTGYYGTYTEACVIQYQKAADLSVDGIAGPEVLGSIYKDDAPEKSKPAAVDSPAETPAENSAPTEEATAPVISADNQEETTQPPTEAPTPAPTEAVTEAPTQAPTEPVTEAPTQAPTENPYKDLLALGGYGDKVTQLQERLYELGYYTGAITGQFDQATLEAMQAYYKASEFKPSDTMTDEQFNYLFTDSALSAPEYDELQLNYEGASVNSLQESLITLGYLDTDQASGVLDENTVNAVKTAQANFALEVTGVADKDFLNAIDLQTAQEQNAQKAQAVIKSASMATGALSTGENGVFEQVSYNSGNDSYVLLVWVAGIMFFISVCSLVVFLKTRKRSAVSANRYGRK